MLGDPKAWPSLPQQVRDWLSMQRWKSLVPAARADAGRDLPRAPTNHYLVCYPFEGRLAHQTLGMLLTRRLERWGVQPLGFVASEYALVVWTVRDLSLMIAAGRLDSTRSSMRTCWAMISMPGLPKSNLMKRTFRNAAIIAGLIERRWPGKEKTGRQVTVNSDLIYDVLRQHEPQHLLLRAAWDDAADGLIDVHRLGALLRRIRGQIVHRALDTVSPLVGAGDA